MIATGRLTDSDSLIVFGSTVSALIASRRWFDSRCVSFDMESRMTTAHGFYAAESYFNLIDSVAAAIVCQRLSLYGSLGLETSSLKGALPDPISPAEVKPVFLPENGFDLQTIALDGYGLR